MWFGQFVISPTSHQLVSYGSHAQHNLAQECWLRYLIMLQFLFHVFKVVIQGSFLMVEGGVLLSGFLTKGDLVAIFAKQNVAWYSPVSIFIQR